MLQKVNLQSILKGKSLLANKEMKSRSILHPLLILVITLLTAPPLAGIASQDSKTFPYFQEIYHLVLYLNNPLLCLFADLNESDI